MKIAFILSTCQKSGPFIVAGEIINNINLQDNQIDIFYIKDSKVKISFKCHRLIKVKLYNRLDLSSYDILHSHGFLGDLYTFLNSSSIQGKWISTLHQKIQVDYGMNYGKMIGILLEKFWCMLLGKCNVVVTLTQEMKVYYESKFSNRLTFIHNGVSSELSLQALAKEDISKIDAFKKKHITLGISANLIFRKGIDQVIRFLSLPDASKFGLIIIGDGPLKSDLISLARQFSVEERCLFLGFKQNAIDYYRFFDVYVMSSRSEGFGLCVIEAASQKIPIVCNSLNVFNELFDTHEICRFKLDDVKSLLEALTYTVQNKDQLSFLVNEKYIKNYTSKIMSNKYFKLYKEVLNEPKDFSSKYEATTKNRNLLFAHWNFYSLCLQSSKIRTNR